MAKGMATAYWVNGLTAGDRRYAMGNGEVRSSERPESGTKVVEEGRRNDGIARQALETADLARRGVSRRELSGVSKSSARTWFGPNWSS